MLSYSNQLKMEDIILNKLKEVIHKKGNSTNKKHSKKFVVLLVTVVLIIAGVFGVSTILANKKKNLQKTKIETELIEKRSLTNSISATGTIQANDSQEEETSLTNYEITSVNVEVGDRVKTGDILCTLDVSDIEESLGTVQKSIEVGEKQNDVSTQSAERSLNYAQETMDAQASQADSNVSTAENKLSEAQSNQSDIESELESAKDKVSSTKKTYNSTKKTYAALEADYNVKNTAYETTLKSSEAAQAVVDNLNSQIAATSDSTVLTDLTNQLTTAKEDLAVKLQATSDSKSQLSGIEASYMEAKTAYESAKTAYETAKTNLSTLETQLDAAETAVETAQTAYDGAITERDNTNRANENTVNSQKENLSSTALTNETNLDSKKTELKNYEDQLEKGNVTAKIDGVVTAVNISAGNTYTGETMFIIEDDSAYQVEATVDEYDIGDIYTGMPVIIKTNATDDEELKGTITYISPTPESQTTTTSSDVNYIVKVSIDSTNDKIRLGMTAKLSIIVDSKDDVYAVPYDVITETADGQGTIQVLKESSGEPETITVTLGMETDYYVEISSDQITEGMFVVVPSTGTDTSELTNMGPMGGF
ncbi:HlyD family efflux transporter periplasmic adaptor subunit [Lachnotalea glycerini]|uniref:HlyD family efflux transporter periplasmic adaptor subunit n=1 Tax=Lachnotalea glycerini TaxID=1763509 RepID=A0A371JJN5_9FIRM|nr:HlyD family efflux transporter periplasmic adaptor subunit [Lachnotalea glycerini]